MTISPRAAIVTGASAGIGLAVTTELCALGFSVVMAARRQERLEHAATTLRAAGHSVLPVVIDVAEPGAAEQLVDAATREIGTLDVVVANAASGRPGTVAGTNQRDTERMLAVNVAAPFALAAAAIP
ncbi:MAG TPA: SDR family NAD(P)-dependent oxidoreductase, partial [Ilumatobacteraceae bacterium]